MAQNNIKTDTFSISLHEGLKAPQVEQLRSKYGRNEFTPPPRVPWWKDFLGKFDDPTIQILLVAAVLSLIVVGIEKWVLGSEDDTKSFDTIGIFFAVALATLVGFFSERKSAKEFELLNRVKDDILVRVLRDGQITEVSIGEIVVGDIVQLSPGDKIPADGVILEGSDLRVEQSMMTGESVPVRKSELSKPLDLTQLEGVNDLHNDFFVARGTMVEDGRGWMCVTAVGDATQMGKIAADLVDDPYKNETPLVAKLSRLARMISAAGATGAMLIFTLMSIEALIASPLETSIPVNILAGLGVVAFVLGVFLERFAVEPFFRSMELGFKAWWIRILSALPMIAVSFSVVVGSYGIYMGGDSVMAGVNLLQAILLAFVVAVTIIVVAVPEGLPMMVTVSLALNMMKMARENCLVRKLVASETIGSATVICTDKTGTLTQNQMLPVWILLGTKEFEQENLAAVEKAGAWQRLVSGIAINSGANLHIEQKDGKEHVHGIGNPTECALLKFIHARKIDYLKARGPEENRLLEIAHTSQRKMSLVVVPEGDSTLGYLKGAPERVLERCSKILIDGKEEPLGPHLAFLKEKMDEASGQTLRVIGFAERRGLPASESECQAWLEDRNYTFIALVGIMDPIREEVPGAVQRCREAGIQVKIITGDALPTAVAIARKAGIYHDSEDELVLTSEEFAKISDEDLPAKAQRLCVLARSTPADKLRLVKALHHDGEVVAMTGDGTNDAPALKFADVGLAMGITGTEVAKEASDIVLVDDNFKSIVTGVWWGRTLFLNIQRFLQFQLSVNVVALVCAFFGPMLGVPLPLTVTQLLWINIIMDTFAAIAYSTDPPRKKTMKAQPIPRDTHIITPTMATNILLVSIFQSVMLFLALFQGWFLAPEKVFNPELRCNDPKNLEALTVFFTMLIMFQFWHKLNCRALTAKESIFTLLSKNHLFLGIIAAITIVQVAMVQIPRIGVFFRTTPLAWEQWGEIALVTASVLPVAWVCRQIAGVFHGNHQKEAHE